MAGIVKPKSLDAFELNMADAYKLVAIGGALTNTRSRRMRREKREALGSALGMPRNKHDQIDCVESPDFFVVLKPGTHLTRNYLDDVKPLYRQALVAGCAALETYVADRVMELLGPVLRSSDKPRRLLDVGMSVEDWYRIDERYTRTNWGVREIVQQHVRREASPAPAQIGTLFAIVGEKGVLNRVDQQLKRVKGTSHTHLEAIRQRRNKIAHEGDRVGRGRASITADEIHTDLDEITAIVTGLQLVTATSTNTAS